MGDTEKRRTGGHGSSRGNDPEARGDTGATDPGADKTRTSREPAEGGDLGLPGADKAAATPREERRKTGRKP